MPPAATSTSSAPATTATHFVDDVSPLIQYKGSWQAGDKSDSEFSKYSNGTFMVSSTKDDMATFVFTGTQVTLYGARRDNHGPYTIYLDGLQQTLDGQSGQATFGPLFTSNALTQQSHTIAISNSVINGSDPNRFLDLDYITWTSEWAAPTKELDAVETAYFAYQPSNAWKTDLGSDLSGFNNNTGYVTTDNDASVTITFAGESCIVYGAVGPNLGSYAVKLDGNDAGTFNATRQNYAASQRLFQTEGLGPANHTLTFTNKPSGTANKLAIDYAVMATIPTSTVIPPEDTKAEGWNNVKKGLFIAAGIGSVCLLLTFIAVFFRCCRPKSKYKAPGGTRDAAAFATGGGGGSKPISLQPMRDPHADTAPLLR
ncbi:hypothetical protein MKEN_00717200 [Mycena kentingensis (nom. inval.)]|nr:hypothetical protein MKEN_00717200 [Mycena kentingensis (nom. inval.)]